MAKVFLGSNDHITLSNSNVTVKGVSGGNEKVLIKSGVTGVTTDANLEAIDFAGALSSYQFKTTSGQGIQIFDGAGVLLTTIPSINADAMKVAFADGTANLVQTGGTAFSLGGQSISTTTITAMSAATLGTSFDTSIKSTLAPLSGTNSIAVSSATPSLTDGGASVTTTYTIAKGNYTSTLAGFGAGDKLVLFSGASVTVLPDTNTNDGKESIQIADSANNIVTIILTGLTPTQENGIYNQNSLNTIFGAGTIA